MVRTLRPKKCRREGRFSERTHRKMAILSLYSVILSLRGCLIYERHVRRSEHRVELHRCRDLPRLSFSSPGHLTMQAPKVSAPTICYVPFLISYSLVKFLYLFRLTVKYAAHVISLLR